MWNSHSNHVKPLMQLSRQARISLVVFGFFLLLWSLKSWLHFTHTGLTGPDVFTDLWAGNESESSHSVGTPSEHSNQTTTTAAAATLSRIPSKEWTSASHMDNPSREGSEDSSSQDRTSASQQNSSLLKGSDISLSQDAARQDHLSLKGYPKPKDLKVAIIETAGFHEEVMAALIHSFGSQPDVQVQLYKQEPRWGIQKIIEGFHFPRGKVSEWQRWEEFRDNGIHNPPDIIFFTTCWADPQQMESTLLQLMNRGRTYIFCIVHETQTWNEPRPDLDHILRPWAERQRLQFITLSPAVTRTLQQVGMQNWPREGDDRIERVIRDFAPVFPVKLPPLPSIEDENEVEDKIRDWIALQGMWVPERRDFPLTFQHFQKLINDLAGVTDDIDEEADEEADEPTKEKDGEDVDENLIEDPNQEEDRSPEHKRRSDIKVLNGSSVELHLIGHGDPRPEVPPRLQSQVLFHEKLLYQEYYELLSLQTGLIPAFSSDIYRWMKASSTVPAALIAGCPLIVDAGTMKSYSYLTEEAVYIQEEGETEFDVLRRVMQEPRAWRVEKKRQVRLRAQRIVEENTLKVREWITEAKAAIGRFR